MNLRAFLPFLLPPGTVDEHVVDNRVFLLGLDQLYRERVKRHESTELLTCARAVAARLNVAPAAVPIEGYYTETLINGLSPISSSAHTRSRSRGKISRSSVSHLSCGMQ